ncbi:hypothetical protein Tco_0114876 [Tanacetum coccineum]
MRNYISTSSCDPPQSVEDRLKLVELMTLCTKLQKQVLDLEEAKTAQAKEFHFKTSECIALEEEKDFKRLHGSRVVAEKEVAEKEVSVATASATTTVDELTLAQTLIEIKAVKPKAVTTTATTITTAIASTRPKATELLQAKEQAELEKGVPQEKASRAVIIKELDSIQAMIDADKQLAARLQAEEQEQFSIEENELESDKSKKQKIDEHVKAKKDDQEEAEMKRHIEIVKDDEVAIDAIPLATKPPMIVEYKIDKDGRMPEEDYERVLWGDLKIMFEPDIKSEVPGPLIPKDCLILVPLGVLGALLPNPLPREEERSLTTFMSSASSAVTYTSVYTDSEPGRVFWGADEEISDGM